MSDVGVYKFTARIQIKILAVLWRDQFSFNLYRDVVKPKYFSNAIHVDMCRIIFDYYNQYNLPPTADVLTEEVSTMCGKYKKKEKLLDDYLDCIETMSSVSLDDIEYIRDKVIAFGKRQSLVDAVLESANILEKEPDTEYPKIEGLVKDALMTGENLADLGTDIYEDVEERFLSYTNDDDVIERIPTGIEKLDYCLGGGLGRTEMGVIVAPPGRGKTTSLISIGGAAIEAGYNVLHISLENNEKQVTRNYDLRLLKKNMEYVKDNVNKSITAMFNIQRYRKGQLRIKKYPTKSVTTQTIRMFLDKLKMVKGFVPDVLIVDYGAILKPISNYNDKRMGIESVYEELRAIADDYNLALWTAAQGNRGALSKKIVSMVDLAECFAIANISDVLACLCQTAKEKVKGDLRLFLPKIRDNPDNIILKGKILYEIKKIEMYDVVENTDDDDEEEESDDWESDKKPNKNKKG